MGIIDKGPPDSSCRTAERQRIEFLEKKIRTKGEVLAELRKLEEARKRRQARRQNAA
jgi:hypothetical protein